MTRRLLILLTVLSLLLCVAVVALWVRSYFVRDELFWANLRLPGEAYGRRSLLVKSNHGALYVGRHKRSRSEGLFWDWYAPNADAGVVNGRHVALGVWVTGPETRPGEYQAVGILLPFWLLLVPCSLPPTAVAYAAWRRSRRLAPRPSPAAGPGCGGAGDDRGSPGL